MKVKVMDTLYCARTCSSHGNPARYKYGAERGHVQTISAASIASIYEILQSNLHIKLSRLYHFLMDQQGDHSGAMAARILARSPRCHPST